MDPTITNDRSEDSPSDRGSGDGAAEAGPRPEPETRADAHPGSVAGTPAITDSDRATMVRAAVTRLGRLELRDALALTADPRFQVPKPVANAINALRKHRDPASVIDRVQYRPAIPYVAAAASDVCLTRTIEVLGDDSDDPTREQLVAALDALGDEFPVGTVAVMLASVADADMASSDLCFGLLDSEERFGLTGWAELDARPASAPTASAGTSVGGATPEQREARRLKKQKDAEERRTKMEAARRAGEEVRRTRKKERAASSVGATTPADPPLREEASVAPRLTRRAHLTPVQEAEFDRDDPWVAGVVFAWVPFDPTQTEGARVEGENGKVRRCVVVAGSVTHLLVRPVYSDGGLKSRDWKSVPLTHWRRSGFDQPTWIDIEVVRVPRDSDSPPVGWLSAADWNALW